MWNKLINYYNTNAKFHSFVVAVEQGAGMGLALAFGGGAPLSKSAWIVAAGTVGGAIWGAAKRWLATNVATEGVEPKQAVK